MKIAYFDCFSGISGDMLIGSLLDAGLDFDSLKRELAKLNLPNYDIEYRQVNKQHLSATKFEVIDRENRVYRHLKDLNKIVEESGLDEEIKDKAKDIFLKIAEAEAKIHHQPLEKVHFHEISAIDTIIDVVGALIGIKLLDIDKVLCSKLNVGSGFVKFSHGKWPVPAPATAEILKNVPIYSSDCKAELVTPTGAAVITTIADSFGDLPEMITEKIGYGAGSLYLEHPNVLRVFIGESVRTENVAEDVISILETNIDDMNPQFYEQIFEELYKNGALEVFLTQNLMKKNRPGILLTVLSPMDHETKLTEIIFKNTTTLGVRLRQEKRKTLTRTVEAIETKLGWVHFKVSSLNGEVLNRVPEYEDCKQIAQKHNLPLKKVYEELANWKIR